MSRFPIYDSLCQEIGLSDTTDTTDLSDVEKNYLLEQAKTLDVNGREVFYAIIHQDELIQNRSASEFSFKQMKHCVRVDYDKLATRTKKLLVAFLKRHEANLNG